MIEHFMQIAPAIWSLHDADWSHTHQAAPFLDMCSDIVSVGRMRWIPGSPHTGKDNVSWYRFDARHSGGPRFYCPAGRPTQIANSFRTATPISATEEAA